jgi:hypothetical protein
VVFHRFEQIKVGAARLIICKLLKINGLIFVSDEFFEGQRRTVV